MVADVRGTKPSTERLAPLSFTFCSSFEENLAAATGECTVMAARRLVWTDHTHPLSWKEELHWEHVLAAGVEPAGQNKWNRIYINHDQPQDEHVRIVGPVWISLISSTVIVIRWCLLALTYQLFTAFVIIVSQSPWLLCRETNSLAVINIAWPWTNLPPSP